MRLKKALRYASCALLLCATAVLTCVSLWAQSGNAARVVPAALRSPDALVPDVLGPNYGLFRCQRGVDPLGRFCYDPFEMRRAYGVDTLINEGYTGAGKTIVIIDAFSDPNLVSDVNYFNTFYGLPGFNGSGQPTFTIVTPDGPPPFDLGWSEEMTLDVEWAHAIAPGANIVLVQALSNADSDILSATKYAVDNRLGDVISQSFGENESCVDPNLLVQEHQLFAEATMKNITLFASSADQGAALQTCDGNSWVKAASSPASDPLVTAVGGTELQATGYPSTCTDSTSCTTSVTPGTYQTEIAWNEGPPYGDYQSLLGATAASGGGFSVLYDEPSYQQGTIHGGKQRGVPDVAYNAAIFHGVLVRFFGNFYLFGGTSCGSPQWAAITAIADQKAGRSLGFINKALYHIGQAQQHSAASFNDVTSGTNSAVEYDALSNPVNVPGFNAGSGWDAVTGLGSLKAAQLVDYLNQFVSAADGTAAIAGSTPHPQGNPSAPGHVKSH